jgi:Zn-dependent M28 family amino/carboxypeptidase
VIDTLPARNVIGIIHGKDTTKSIVIGAHYDHLGMRNGLTFNGADDNASGVAGLLSLAKKWATSGEKPPCNLIFCAWTAEEKGQLGSKYFVRHTGAKPGKVLICFNMDMISRSAPEDTTGRQISIGTLPVSENLRQMANEINKRFARPFEFELWDVTGHTGSDYRFFSEAGIPVMTFFSGYNSDYHTPGDTSDKIDIQKMNDILILVNECIRKVLLDSYGN